MTEKSGNLPQGFIVDSILPEHEVHLIFGPITEDCMLLALSIFEEWSHNRPVFGFESHLSPAAYVSCEQSENSVRQGLQYMGIDPIKLPFVSLIGRTKPEDHNMRSVLSFAKRYQPKVRVIFIDGILSLCGGKVNDFKESARFMRDTIALCQSERVTIIGCVSTSKSKEGAGYVSTRDRMHGSSALQGASRAKILIEPNRVADDLDPSRTVTLFPPFGPTLKFQYSRETGPLAYVCEGPYQASLDGWLYRQEPGIEIPSQVLQTLATQLDVSHATLYRWIGNQIKLGTLVKSKHGIYIVPEREPS